MSTFYGFSKPKPMLIVKIYSFKTPFWHSDWQMDLSMEECIGTIGLESLSLVLRSLPYIAPPALLLLYLTRLNQLGECGISTRSKRCKNVPPLSSHLWGLSWNVSGWAFELRMDFVISQILRPVSNTRCYRVYSSKQCLWQRLHLQICK
jgi:hypothetical protein